MQFSNIKWIIPLIGTFSLAAHAQIMTPGRGSLSCGLLMDDIYCFSQDKANITINKLNIKHNKESSLSFLSSQWDPIKSNSTGINIESRLDSQIVVLTDGKQILFNGGFNSMNTPLADQTVVYNAQKNAWVKVQNFDQNPVGNKSIYSGSATAVSLGKVAFFGGQEQRGANPVESVGTNISAAHTSVTGYSQLTLYDTINNIWSIYTPQTNTPTTISSFYQSSIFYSNTLYYFGGLYYDTASPNNGPSKHSMAYAITFNFNTGAWGKESLGGAITPTSRIFHTTTLLPSTGRDVLLYGGSDGVTQSEDYIYVLNLDNMRWSTKQILPPYRAVMTRSNHAAVMANKNSLFIISDPSSSSETDMVILDVSTPSSVRYADMYSDKPTTTSDNQEDFPNYPVGAQTEGLSNKPGMIAATVCSIIGFILIIAACIFCVRKRKARAKRFEEEQNKAQIMQLQETRYESQQQQQKKPVPPPPAPLLTQSYDQPPMSPPPPYNPQILNNVSTSQWNSNDGKRFYNTSKPHQAANSPFVQYNAASSSSSDAQQGYPENLSSSSTKVMMPK